MDRQAEEEEEVEETELNDLSSLAHYRWLYRMHDAIAQNNLKVMRQLFQPPWSSARENDDQFSSPIRRLLESPLVHSILASRRRFVEFLVRERGERIPFPHDRMCRCSVCIGLHSDPQLSNAYAEVVLTAMSSPLYVFSRPSDEDAAQFCINLKKRLSNLEYFQRHVEPSTISKIHSNIEDSLCMLLDACQNSTDSAVALNSYRPHTKYVYTSLGHVRLMAKYRLVRPFVHRTTAALINQTWERGPAWMKTLDHFFLPLSMLVHFLAYFLVIPFAIFIPVRPLTVFITRPKSKAFLDSVAMCLMLTSIVMNNFVFTNGVYLIISGTLCQSTNPLYPAYIGITIAVVFYSAGRLCKTAYAMWILGPMECFSVYNMYFWINQIGVVFYLIGHSLQTGWLYALAHRFDKQYLSGINTECLCAIAREYYQPDECKQNNTYLNILMSQCGAPVSSMVRDVETLVQPQFYSSLLIAFGQIFHIIPLANILIASPKHGFIVLTTTAMARDVGAFAIFLIIIMAAFSLAMPTIYGFFQCFNSNFDTVGHSALTFYWTLFGMSNYNAYQLSKQQSGMESVLVNYFGLFFFGSFAVFGNIVLVNLLIAMMSSSFSRTEEQKDQLYKFYTLNVKLADIRIGECLPVPFDLMYPVYMLACLARDEISKGRKKGMKATTSPMTKPPLHAIKEDLRRRIDLVLVTSYPDKES